MAYKRALPRLKILARTLTANPTQADDLLQETSMRLYTKHSHFTEGSNYLAWSSQVMRNVFFSLVRTDQRRARLARTNEIQHAQWTADRTVTSRAEMLLSMSDLLQVVHQLSPKLRLVFDLYYEGYTTEEICDMTGLPSGTVKSRMHFARKKLISQIAKLN